MLGNSTAMSWARLLTASPEDSTKALVSGAVTEVSDIQSFWNMAQYGGGVGYVIMGVLAVGLFLIVLKGIELLVDHYHSRPFLRASLAGMSFPEIEALSRNKDNSMLGETFRHLLAFYHSLGSAANMQQEVAAVIEQHIERFESFRNRLHFLSDSAGALGLLGTVWGVFLTFFGGNLDSEKILNGMGVALVTTLLGLVVSLIINLFSTEIYSFHHRKLDTVNKKADELRLRLLEFDRTGQKPAPAAALTVPESLPESVCRLRRLEAKPLRVPAGRSLLQAVRLRVVDQDDEPVPEAVVEGESDGRVTFGEGQIRSSWQSDAQGEVAIDLFAGEKTGESRLRFTLQGAETQPINVAVTVTPDKPAKLQIEKGSDQMGKVNKKLPEPLKVAVLDRFGNPVPDTTVFFKLTNGEGEFSGGNHFFETKTDAKGTARAVFRLGEKTGFHTIHALIKNSEAEAAEFHILSKT